jgi:hypothetical protein
MKKLLKTNFLAVLFLCFVPLGLFAQENGDAFRDIEPPPTPIDDYVVFFALLAIVLAGFLFYKRNIKLEN